MFAAFAASPIARRHRHRLFQQALVLLAGHQLQRRLHEGEVGVVGNHRLGEGGELHALFAELRDLAHDLLDRGLPAVQHGAELHGGGLHEGAHRTLPFSVGFML
jgi:hypothetical protein